MSAMERAFNRNHEMKPEDHPFFSIITASFNSAATLAMTLDSVQYQTFTHHEHIVIDGGSTDGTLDVLKCYEGLYPLRWISEPDRGIAHALNKAFTRSTGRYLFVLQADDTLLDSAVLDGVNQLIRGERYDICSFQVIREHHGSPPFRYLPIRLPEWYHFKHTIPHQGAFVHRRLYERIGGFREQFSIAMDYDFFYRAFKARAKIRYFHQPVSRMGGYGISSRRQVMLKRLEEEKQVQNINEKNLIWRIAQEAFRLLYIPYKTRCLRWQKQMCARVEPPSPS